MPFEITPYANDAARTSRLPNPTPGQAVFMLDTGNVLFYYGAQLGWCPAWNLAWGEQAYAEITTASAVVGTLPSDPLTIAGLSVTFTPKTGRQYAVEFEGSVVSNANADALVIYIDTADVSLAGCGTSRLHFASASKAITLNGIAPDVLRFLKRFTHGPTPLTFTVAAAQLIGSNGQVFANACGVSAVRILDVGPAAAPTYR